MEPAGHICPHTIRRRATTLVLTFTMALALSACGSSKSGKSATPPTTKDTSAQDKAAAPTLVLKASDLPLDWESAPHDPGNAQDKEIGQQLATCLNVKSTAFDEGPGVSASADSDDFSQNGGATAVWNTVSIERTTSDAAQLLAVVRRSDWPRCFNQAFKTAFSNTDTGEATVTDVTTKNLNVTQALEKSVATRTTITIASQGITVPAYADFVFMQRGRVVGLMMFIDTSTPFDTSLQQKLITTVANRISSANIV